MRIRPEWSKIRGTEMLFIDMFGHKNQQPSPWRDVYRILSRSILTFVYRWRCLVKTTCIMLANISFTLLNESLFNHFILSYLFIHLFIFFLLFAGIPVCPLLWGLSPVECEKGNDRISIEKDEWDKYGIEKTEGCKEGERQRDEPLREKTNDLHMRKQRRRLASRQPWGWSASLFSLLG